MTERRRFVSVTEFAASTGIPASTIRHRCERGVYRASKPRGRWRIPVQVLREELRKGAS